MDKFLLKLNAVLEKTNCNEMLISAKTIRFFAFQSPVIQVIQVDGANDSDSEEDDDDEDDLDDEARKDKSQSEGLDEEAELEVRVSV